MSFQWLCTMDEHAEKRIWNSDKWHLKQHVAWIMASRHLYPGNLVAIRTIWELPSNRAADAEHNLPFGRPVPQELHEKNKSIQDKNKMSPWLASLPNNAILSRHPTTQSTEQRNDKQLPAAASAVPNVTAAAARMIIYQIIGLEYNLSNNWIRTNPGVSLASRCRQWRHGFGASCTARETSDVSVCVLPRHPRTFSCFSCELSASETPCAFKVLPGSPVHLAASRV
jgi:hypothetical protein